MLKKVARKTDLIRATKLSKQCELYLKTENLQETGSFKLRGAYYKISQLTEEEKSRGIIACSAGNHAQGVAMAATQSGIQSLICMPDGAPISKVEATKQLGAEVRLVKGAYDDAYATALQLQEDTGATFIHPFDDDEVIAGQGTIGLEILDELENPDAVVVPIGGGGLISGVAYAIKHLNPNVKIYGVQAAGAASMVKSQQEGTPITLDILALIEKQKVIAEGAGAVSVAAVLFHKLPVEGKKVVCIVSGGNIDVNILSRVITRGLLTSGRNVSLTIALTDKPGQLQEVSEIIARCGGNVVSVHHDRSDANMAITSCFLKLGLETRDHAQIVQIQKELTQAGFHLVSERV